jgi:hypothetical protein
MDTKIAEPLSDGAVETVWCLFLHGPTWDGNLPSKAGRDQLVEYGYAERFEGWNWLTFEGVTLATGLGYGRRKDARQRKR